MRRISRIWKKWRKPGQFLTSLYLISAPVRMMLAVVQQANRRKSSLFQPSRRLKLLAAQILQMRQLLEMKSLQMLQSILPRWAFYFAPRLSVVYNKANWTHFLHKTKFFSESCFGDLMLYVAVKFNLKRSLMLVWSFLAFANIETLFFKCWDDDIRYLVPIV